MLMIVIPAAFYEMFWVQIEGNPASRFLADPVLLTP